MRDCSGGCVDSSVFGEKTGRNVNCMNKLCMFAGSVDEYCKRAVRIVQNFTNETF